MSKEKLKMECQAWRNLWGWIPPEVKYYVARTGQQIGVVQRNYQRSLGTLMGTHWDLVSLEIGMVDKTYDQIKDKYYFESKVAIININALLNIQWIKERKDWETLEAETKAEEEEKNKKEGKEELPVE